MSMQQVSRHRALILLVGLAIVVVAFAVGRFADRFGLIVVLLVVFFAAGLVALAGGVASNGLGQFGTSLGIQPASTAAPTPQRGSLGTSFTETDDSSNTMSLALSSVVDPAHGTSDFDQPSTGNRFVATEFKITGIRGSSADNANNDASLVGDNQHVYAADLDDVSECTNFDSGDYKVAPAEVSTGCVVFQVPVGVAVSQVTWTPEFGATATIWNVP